METIERESKYVLNAERCILVIYILSLLVISLSLFVPNQFEATYVYQWFTIIGL